MITRGRSLKPLVGACFLTAFVLAMLASAAVSGLATPAPARAATNWPVLMESDGMGGYYFTPSTITVNVGDTVNWTDMAGQQTTTSDPGQAESWDSGSMNPGQSFTHTFNTPGTYTYSSTLDVVMTGKVVVSTPVPEFPGLFAFAAVGMAVCVALALERALERSP